MWVKVMNGPEWAIGLRAKVDGDTITFYNHMGEPHWYEASKFAYVPSV